MYSLGVIFFEMNYPPMLGMQRAQVMEALRKPDISLPADFDTQERSAQTAIILSLMTHVPKDRPSSAELIKSGQLPMEMESDSIRRALAGIADPASQYYDKMLETLFARQVEPAKDFAWDMTQAAGNINGSRVGRDLASSIDLMPRQLAREALMAIFRRHGAVESPRSVMLYPRSTRYNGTSAVEVLNRNGLVLQLPYDLLTGHARMLAKQTGGTLSASMAQRTYCFGDVFRDRKDGGQPLMFGEVDFDIVTNDTLDMALKEAEVLKVIDEIIATFPALSSKLMCFHLGHSDLLNIIFDYCGVEASAKKPAAEVLSKLNIRSFTWQKLRGELRSPVVGVSATSVDELGRFDFRGRLTNIIIELKQTFLFLCAPLISIPDTPTKAFARLKTLFEGSESYQKAAPTIAHLKEVYEYTKRLGLVTKTYVMPLLSLNEAFYPGGILFSCLYDKKVKDVFAAGGRYDGLIREHRPRIGGRIEERHAVGFALNWERQLAQVPKTTGKAFLKKGEVEETSGLLNAKRVSLFTAPNTIILRLPDTKFLVALLTTRSAMSSSRVLTQSF
jgi:eukaryotic translation initiation factor 2-alpha kinase 4